MELAIPAILLGNPLLYVQGTRRREDEGEGDAEEEEEEEEAGERILDPRELIHVTPAIDQNLRRGDGSIHDRLPSIKRIERQPGKQERAARRDRRTGCLILTRCF